MSLFVLSLVALLMLLATGLILADESLRQSADAQIMLDATSSARIVAQEVALVGERLHELGTKPSGASVQDVFQDLVSVGDRKNEALRAVWLLDTLGQAILDSAWFDDSAARRIVLPADLYGIARHIVASRHLQVRGLPGAGGNERAGQALLGEPVLTHGVFTNIAVALVDEGALLAPAGNAAVAGRSFLALLVDGDTVAQSPRRGTAGQRSSRVRVPLPGEPAWFVVSFESGGRNTIRFGIWLIGSSALILLVFGLIRERRQTARIAERSVELERLSAELLRANRMKSEFLANVSHELRTPLNAIVGFVDLLRDGGYGELSERQRSPIERVSTSAARLRTLVDQVLDIAKIAAGRLDVHVEVIAVRPFLLNIVSEIEPLLIEKGLTVEVNASTNAPKIRTDPTHLRQVVINLLGNAVKYTEQGHIELRTRTERMGPPPRNLAVTGQHSALRPDQAIEWFAIDVIDTGIGIAAGDLERIFEEFEQVATSGSPEPERRGTGLGLAISRRLMTLLGGDVSVESTIGRGSTFTIWLPLREETAR